VGVPLGDEACFFLVISNRTFVRGSPGFRRFAIHDFLFNALRSFHSTNPIGALYVGGVTSCQFLSARQLKTFLKVSR
jgi:hypothetical protein